MNKKTLQSRLLEIRPAWLPSDDQRATFYQSLSTLLDSGGKLLCVGNGGSMVQAQHLAEELAGKFDKFRPALGGLAVTDPSFITCVANDFGFEQVFSRAVEAYLSFGDGLILFSTSGESENLLRACARANELAIQTYAMLGGPASSLAQIAGLTLEVQQEVSKNLIQVIHTLWIHELLETIERTL